MRYRSYGKTGFKVSALGVGCMRLPRIFEGNETRIDREKAIELIRYAADNGITYFDTALGYHKKESEAVLGEALDGVREKVRIATKQPFFLMTNQGEIRRNLENTLKKLRTSYIDAYLIHNVQAESWEAIKQREVIKEYEKFKSEGLIKAIGFSYHGKFPGFKNVLDYYSWDMCQVQQNFLDTENEATVEAIGEAGRKGCALVIMEPLRGGGLAVAPPAVAPIYDSFPVKRNPVEWAFRYLLNRDEVSVILSGVTTLEQLKENIEIFSKDDAVPGCMSGEELELLAKVKQKYESLTAIPCTGCEYCMPCPQGVEIPMSFRRYNEGTMFGDFTQAKRGYLYFVERSGGSPSKCVDCKACEEKCPQRIKIPENLKKVHETLSGWIE